MLYFALYLQEYCFLFYGGMGFVINSLFVAIGHGDLVVTFLPLDSRFAGSNPAG
jgi:hypothetical protein